MGLDWAISPWPEQQNRDRDNGCDFSPRFRAERLRQTNLPDHILQVAWEDMTYWKMKDYAETLEQAINDDHREYDEESVELIEDAIAWLQYWGEKEKSIFASY